MKQVSLLFILLFALGHSLAAQDSICISGQLKGNTHFDRVVVKKFGVGVFDIAVVPIKNEKFSIKAPTGIEPGVYRFQYNQSSLNEYVDVIIDGREKEINFTLDVSQDKRVPVFTQSVENINWYAYKQATDIELKKIDLLQQLLTQYPDTTEAVYRTAEKVVNSKIKTFEKQFQRFVMEHSTGWAGVMVANTPCYFTCPRNPPQLQDYYRKCNYWKGINTTNPALMNTPLYIEKILAYLRYYINSGRQSSESEINESLKNNVDTIMKKFDGNAQTRQFALKFLQLGFREIANEKVLQYINEKYTLPTGQCDNNGIDKPEFESRMAGYEAMKPGTPAPDIALTAADGKLYGLKAIPNKKLIVVFWGSWCTNCEREMPRLEAYIKQQPEYGVVAVGLDDDSVAYHKAAKLYPTMIHYCDFRKWQSKAAKEYCIVATPTFILLDEERKIIGKYPDFETMAKEL